MLLVTGPTLENCGVMTAKTPLMLRLAHRFNVARLGRDWMRLVTLAALWNVCRRMRHKAMWRGDLPIGPPVIVRGLERKFSKRSVATQANILANPCRTR